MAGSYIRIKVPLLGQRMSEGCCNSINSQERSMDMRRCRLSKDEGIFWTDGSTLSAWQHGADDVHQERSKRWFRGWRCCKASWAWCAAPEEGRPGCSKRRRHGWPCCAPAGGGEGFQSPNIHVLINRAINSTVGILGGISAVHRAKRTTWQGCSRPPSHASLASCSHSNLLPKNKHGRQDRACSPRFVSSSRLCLCRLEMSDTHPRPAAWLGRWNEAISSGGCPALAARCPNEGCKWEPPPAPGAI
jgi:hypothetical protein